MLIAAYIVVIMADVLTVSLLYLHWFLPRMMVLTFTCALKLRIELLVLNRLSRFGKRDSIAGNNLASGGTDESMIKPASAPSTPMINPGDESVSPFGHPSAGSMEPVLGRKREVSIWNVDGPACPIPMRLGGSSEINAAEGKLPESRDSIDDLEKQYLGPFKDDDLV
jgi:hypothetical protein